MYAALLTHTQPLACISLSTKSYLT